MNSIVLVLLIVTPCIFHTEPESPSGGMIPDVAVDLPLTTLPTPELISMARDMFKVCTAILYTRFQSCSVCVSLYICTCCGWMPLCTLYQCIQICWSL